MKGVFFGPGVSCFSTDKHKNIRVSEVIPTNDVEPKFANDFTAESVKFLSKGFFVSDAKCMMSLSLLFNPSCTKKSQSGNLVWEYDGVIWNVPSNNLFSLFTQYNIPRPIISIKEDTEESIVNLPEGEDGLDDWCSEYVESIPIK